MSRIGRWGAMGLLLAGVACCVAPPASARMRPEDPESQMLNEYEQEVMARIESNRTAARRNARPLAIPDIFGAGSVLNVGDFVMKVTNNGLVGNPFTNVSSDPSGQWPGTSAIEYLNFVGIAMGAVNPFSTDPNAIRRVSYITEWRPATLDPEDRIYRSYDGIVNGIRYVNDDGDFDPLTGDGRFDEDFLDGRDNDGDGLIDEDFAAIGQQMYTCVIRDDTQQAVDAAAAERHVPLGGDVGKGIECRQSAWAYSIPGFTNFNVVNWRFFNRSGHELDSVVIGFRADMDCGPADKVNFFSDDFDANQYPFGNFVVLTKDTDLRLQDVGKHPPVGDVDPDSALCPRYIVRVQGFSVADDDGDDNKTTGVPSLMLIDHSIDPTGENGPNHVGFRAFRSFPTGQPYVQGGNPIIDQQRFEFMTSRENISRDISVPAEQPDAAQRPDPNSPAMFGFISQPPGDQKSDYSAWSSIGPWLRWPADGELEATVAIGVRTGSVKLAQGYPVDYLAAAKIVKTDAITGVSTFGVTSGQALLDKYPSLDNALAAQLAFEGTYESRAVPPLTDAPGRETGLKAPPGQVLSNLDCHDQVSRPINDRQFTWFDFDCNYCTGAYSSQFGGLFHHTWLAESPPPSPNTNLSVSYNFTQNPERRFPPAGDGQVTIAWDNLSENTPDPKTGAFDFRGYKIWKVSNWSRPVGSSGPAEDDWTLVAEYRLFDYAPTNQRQLAGGGVECPNVYIPQKADSVRLCLTKGDLWDRQSGDIIHPDPSVLCVNFPNCLTDSALILGSTQREGRIRFPVGRYRYVDRQVKDGFLYFYSVTAEDSTGAGQTKVELNGRRSAVEAEGVMPQSNTSASSRVRVVPNPYRGVRVIRNRPSAWDLTPNATDPTGTHIDFMGLPSGAWTIRIYTLSGDLVNTLHSTDAVNASTRSALIQVPNPKFNPNLPEDPVTNPRTVGVPNTTQQQDTAGDGQASWNLISRNGQDVVSGIYLFTLQSSRGTERGKFIIIR